MASFARVTLNDGSEIYVQTIEDHPLPDGLGLNANPSLAAIEKVASAADEASKKFRELLKPDEIALEVSVGFSAAVGWFWAKSEAEATIKLSLSWKSDATESSSSSQPGILAS